MSAFHSPFKSQQQQQNIQNNLARAVAEAVMAHQPYNTNISAAASSTGSDSATPSRKIATAQTKPKKKRLNHNELERKRRHHQREVLYELRDVIPNLHMVKPSTVLIMQKSKDYIDLLRRTIQEMEVEINDLRRALIAAGYPLPMPNQQPIICGFPTSQPQFGSTVQSPHLLSEQLLNVTPQNHLSIDSHTQLSFQGLSDISLSRAHFDSQDIENINHLHSVLSKGAVHELAACTARPISPVSPYQLDQIQGCSSGEFKKQSNTILLGAANLGTEAAAAAASASSIAPAIITHSRAALGSHT
ncbi:hypothetical protein BX070DRAFT_226516 [Coemansia spiralis]|nr:hypothetical protein BX070DRAFT_226516 [Coemansia spiralis]